MLETIDLVLTWLVYREIPDRDLQFVVRGYEPHRFNDVNLGVLREYFMTWKERSGSILLLLISDLTGIKDGKSQCLCIVRAIIDD